MAAQRREDLPYRATPRIASDEIILKRLPPPKPGGPTTTITRPGIGLTATSFVLQPRPNEEHPSWSRHAITAPVELLKLAETQGIDIRGWSVCAVTVQDVRDLGLDVVATPTDEDPGHCEIVPTERQRFTGKIWSKLALRALVDYTHSDEASDRLRRSDDRH